MDTMFKWLNRLIKLAILLVVVALIFDFHYKGRSSRDYAWEYGRKAFAYLYDRAKALMGKDLEEITPHSISEVPAKLKEITGVSDKKEQEAKVAKENPSSPPSKGDALTDEDREALKKLLEQKSQKK